MMRVLRLQRGVAKRYVQPARHGSGAGRPRWRDGICVRIPSGAIIVTFRNRRPDHNLQGRAA